MFADSTESNPINRLRRGRALDDGTFAICGLPVSYVGTLQVQRGAMTSPEAPVESHEQMLGAILLTMNVSGDSTSVLKGRVTVKGGTPIAGAQVAVEGATSVAITGADGSFTMTGLPSGTRAAVVRKIGFAPATVGINLTSRQPREINVSLVESHTLATVRIVGKMEAGLQQVGFTDRQRSGHGQFISPDEIEKRRPLMFTDMIQARMGFKVTNMGAGRIVQSTHGASGTSDGCVNIFVDRMPFEQMSAGDLDDTFPVADMGAIELYSSPIDVPAEFHVNGKTCSTIAMWTKTKLGRS
ncbi:MAG: carboxypeptidase-like regulatory domain-containing protein [Gemmatimonadales bacterium]